MTRDDMVISHVFDVTKLNIGKCYKFKCGESNEKQGILTEISEQFLTFNTVSNNFFHDYKCDLCSYNINANDFYNDETSYIIELT